MRIPRADQSPARALAIAALLVAAGWTTPAAAQDAANMIDTKHNLSISGPGTVRALTEDRICIFCHTPHNTTPLTPLWNRELPPQTYTVYTSPTLRAGPLPQPTGPTKLCLSCHDGMIAMGAVINPAGGIAMSGSGRFPPGSLSEFGLDLSGHHPVSFPYSASLPDPELAPTPPDELVYGGIDEVHCVTCHDPHDDRNGRFLIKDNRYSALCITCHQMPGWSYAAHAVSSVSVVGYLPRPPKTWPTWTTLGEWGCETCHTPHFAPTAPQLLNFTSAPPNPFSCTTSGCHTTDPGPPHLVAGAASGAAVAGAAPFAARRVDIGALVRKPSAHHEPADAGAVGASPDAARSGVRAVTCADCHNPHVAREESAEAPYVSGLLRGVSGVDRDGATVDQARYEYEICFKCHGDSANKPSYPQPPETVAHAVPETNLRRQLDLSAPSYHPVEGPGRNPDVPGLVAPLTASSTIFCSDCHAPDDGPGAGGNGPRGPHGSIYRHLLERNLITADNTLESPDAYALCYKCHQRQVLLSDGSGFKPHKRHVVDDHTPCTACHNWHGVSLLAGNEVNNAHLIDFDVSIVGRSQAGQRLYTTLGPQHGTCSLACHGHDHANASY
jgi:predicted CXXCH cytochrome family protein